MNLNTKTPPVAASTRHAFRSTYNGEPASADRCKVCGKPESEHAGASRHTPEPLRVTRLPLYVHAEPDSQLGVKIACQHDSGTDCMAVMECYIGNQSDAARLVAAYNATLGMADPAAEIAEKDRALRLALEYAVNPAFQALHGDTLEKRLRAALAGKAVQS